MKLILALSILVGCVGAASAQGLYGSSSGSGLYGTGSNSSSHYVRPYVNSQGGYVQGHRATNPNSTQMDNYGTRGNYNPYTGAFGTRNPRY